MTKEITIDPKLKTIRLVVDDITSSELKVQLSHFVNMNDYEIFVHNSKQSTDLIDVYDGNVLIDNLYKIK